MGAPTGLSLTFDQPSYSPGTTITATLQGTAGTTGEEWVLTGVLAKKTDPTVTADVTGTYTVEEPDTLTGSVSDESGRTWAPGEATQEGAAFSQPFTTTA